MKQRIFFLLMILFLNITLFGQEKYLINFSTKDLSFKEFVAKAESLLPVKFFYKESWIDELRLSGYSRCKTLPCVLDSLFRNKKIQYFIDGSGYVVITGNYVMKDINAPEEKEIKENLITDSRARPGPEPAQQAVNMVVGNPADRTKTGNVVISGYITNGATKEPVTGATVFVQKFLAGTVANAYGYYTLSLPRGNHLIRFSFIGMTEKLVNLTLNGTGQLNIEMLPNTISLSEVIVSTQKSNILQRFEVGAEKINIGTFKLLPTSMGESDLLKSLILIPGVKSVGEGSAGFNVRGGSADQNLILLYGAPIYNSSHVFGFFSSVNSDIIKDVTLYKGGIPSRFGGRISSVLDIESKEGNRKEFAGSAGISPITARIAVEGPIIKDTLSYIFTGRTTYSNWIFGLLSNKDLKNSRASFYDMNGKITWNIDKNNIVDISSYFSHDFFRFNARTEYGYDNNIVSGKFLHFFSSKFYSVVSVNNSSYRYDITNQDIPTESYILSHKINSTGLKADFNLSKGINEFNFGIDANRYEVLPGSYRPATDTSLIIPNVIEKDHALEAAVYLEDKIFITKFLSASAGMRFSSFFTLGPRKIYTYGEGFSKSNSTIIDTLSFRPGKVISKSAGPEFRASLNFRISDRNSIKINYNRTRQYLHLLLNTTSISPTDTWKLCDYYLKPEIGDQFALGFYKIMFKNGFETSAEVYYKTIKNMVDFKGGSTLTMVENIEQTMIDVRGKAYGLELSLKKTGGKIRYSIGYTYSRTFVKSLGKFRDEIINSGKWYPANYDRPNDLVVTFQYSYSRRLSFTADYTYSTGRPITYPLSTYSINNILLVQYSDRNKYRIPDNSRLDISLKVSGNLRSHKIAHPNLTFSVYNLLGRPNPYSVYFRKEGTVFKGYLLSVFGRPIPSVTFNFDF
jgi:hypothetical protein